MNRYAREITARFTSQSNRVYLQTTIQEYFDRNHPQTADSVSTYMSSHFEDALWHAATKNEHEMRMSDPIPGVSIVSQLQCINNTFIRDRIDFIRTHIIANVETPDVYTITDGIPTTRHGRGWEKLTANQLLDSWKFNANHPVRARDDPSGELGVGVGYGVRVHDDYTAYNDAYTDGYGRNGQYGEPLTAGFMPQHTMSPHNSHYGMPQSGRAAPTMSGITFCDQSGLGTSNHMFQYEDTQYKNALNREVSYANTPMGVSTPMADARLLERRTFRSAFSVGGVENGVSRYEARLQRRHIDRDPSEGFRGESRDCHIRGYDMQSLYDRTDYHTAAREKNRPPCGPRPYNLDSTVQFFE